MIIDICGSGWLSCLVILAEQYFKLYGWLKTYHFLILTAYCTEWAVFSAPLPWICVGCQKQSEILPKIFKILLKLEQIPRICVLRWKWCNKRTTSWLYRKSNSSSVYELWLLGIVQLRWTRKHAIQLCLVSPQISQCFLLYGFHVRSNYTSQ